MPQQEYIVNPLIYTNTVEKRLYQSNKTQIALDRNTLVILPTAFGKTIISVD